MLTFLGKQLGRLSKSEKDGLVRKDGINGESRNVGISEWRSRTAIP
jgi:hypothetical protein